MQPITAALPVAAASVMAPAALTTETEQPIPAEHVPARAGQRRETTALPMPAPHVAAVGAAGGPVEAVVADGQPAVVVEGPADTTAAARIPNNPRLLNSVASFTISGGANQLRRFALYRTPALAFTIKAACKPYG
jgi:hypothetical protein